MVEEQHIVQQEQERAMELEHELGHYHHHLCLCLCLYPDLCLYHTVEEEAKQLIEASNDQEDDCIREQVDVEHYLQDEVG